MCKVHALTRMYTLSLILLFSSSVGSVFISHDHIQDSGQAPGSFTGKDFVKHHWFIAKDRPKGCS